MAQTPMMTFNFKTPSRQVSCGFFLPAVALLLALLTLMLANIRMAASQTPIWNSANSQGLQQVGLLHEALVTNALLKGYSNGNEVGALTCHDTTGDGVAEWCPTATPEIRNGQMATKTQVRSSGMTQAPSIGAGIPGKADLWLSTGFTSGNDHSDDTLRETGFKVLSPLNSNPSEPLLLAWASTKNSFTRNGDTVEDLNGDLSISRSSRQHVSDVQFRIKSAFLDHLRLCASLNSKTLNAVWAFSETLHLKHVALSSGSRFSAVSSGCRCECNKTECKCTCASDSEWGSAGNCVSKAKSGLCKTVSGESRCSAKTGEFCYFSDAAWLSSHWAVSQYNPRATAGKNCRPQKADQCPLIPSSSKSSSTCQCEFDWPKVVTAARIEKLSLNFNEGKASAGFLASP
ncbi:MAG: hypothetical protein LW629_06620 [Burkholderiales bacterium]|nr:hypothetical protein [Burkholderiales bacterium]